MALWVFGLGYEGGVTTDQIVIAEGSDEIVAAEEALAALNLSEGVVLIRPGSPCGPDETARWRSLRAAGTFPLVAAAAGRTALFARGR